MCWPGHLGKLQPFLRTSSGDYVNRGNRFFAYNGRYAYYMYGCRSIWSTQTPNYFGASNFPFGGPIQFDYYYAFASPLSGSYHTASFGCTYYY